MADVRSCLSRVGDINRADSDNVLGKIDDLVSRGVPTERAQVTAVRQAIADLREEKLSIAKAAIAQRPETFEPLPEEAPETERPPEPKVLSTGKIMGSPTEAPTAKDRDKIIKRMLEVMESPFAMAEESWDWYERSGSLIRELSRGDEKLMERMVRLYAIASKGSGVGANQRFVINALHREAVGLPMQFGRMPNAVRPVLQKLLDPNVRFDEDLKGDHVSDKVINFYRNLHDAAFQDTTYTNALTLDRWMMRAAGFDYVSDDNSSGRKGKANLSDAQYVYLHDLMLRVTDAYNKKHGTSYLPRHIQSLIWAYERNNASYNEYLQNAQAGEIALQAFRGVETKKSKTAGDRVIQKAQERLARFKGVKDEKAYIAEQIEKAKNFRPSNMSFLEDFSRVAATVTTSTLPTLSFGDWGSMFAKAPFETRMRFEMLAREMIKDADGNDIILKKLSASPMYSWVETFGTRDGMIIPTKGLMIPLPKGHREQSQTRLADAYAALWGHIFHQDSVSWHMKPEAGMRKEDTVHAVVFVFDQPVTPMLAGAVTSAVKSSKALRNKNVGFSAIGDKVVLTNHSAMSDKDFSDAALNALDKLTLDLSHRQGEVVGTMYETRLYSKTLTKEDDNGNGYSRYFTEAGIGTDVAKWADSARAAYFSVLSEFVAEERQRQGTARPGGEVASAKGTIREQGEFPESAGVVQSPIRAGSGPQKRHVPGLGNVTFGPSDWIVGLAKQYAAQMGIELSIERHDVPSANVMREIAAAYDEIAEVSDKVDPNVLDAWEQLVRETYLQYQTLKKELTVELMVLEEGQPMPYESVNDMALDIANKRHLYVFPDTAGAKTPSSWKNPMYRFSGERDINGKPMSYHDLFKVVHNVFGHAMYGTGFGVSGELNAYRIHASMYSGDAAKAAATELLGRTAWENFGPKASTDSVVLAPPKMGFLPEKLVAFEWPKTMLANDMIVRDGGTKKEEAFFKAGVEAWGRDNINFSRLRLVTPLFNEVVSAQDVQGRAADGMLAEQIAAKFGKQIVWYVDDLSGQGTQLGVYGFYVNDNPALKHVIFLNANSPTSYARLLGHELLHSLRNTDPNLYAVIRYALRGYLKNRDEYARRATRYGGDRSQRAIDAVEEEMFADLLGEFMVDPKFWRDLQLHAPGQFDKFISFVMNFLQDIWDYLTKGFRNQKFWALNPSDLVLYASKDLNAIRSAMAQGLSAYYKRLGMTDKQKRYSLPPAFKIDALHGSHASDIAQFLLDYVNTGEGAQVYSWGLYVTSLEQIAQWYAGTVGRKRGAWRMMFNGDVVEPFDDAGFYDAVNILIQNAKVFGEVTESDIAKFMATAAKDVNNGNVLEGSIGSLGELIEFTEAELSNMSPVVNDTMTDEELRAFVEERSPVVDEEREATKDAWIELHSAFDSWRKRARKTSALASEGTIYKLEIDADPEHFLFWDEPKQSKYVEQRVIPDINRMLKNDAALRENGMRVVDRLYKQAMKELIREKHKEPSEALREVIDEHIREVRVAREAAANVLLNKKTKIREMGWAIASIQRHITDSVEDANALTQYASWVVEGLNVAGWVQEGRLKVGDLNGEQMYHLYVAAYQSEKEASLHLNSLGIAGMRYYDGVSRYDDERTRTYNYVLYNDKLITIVNKETKTFAIKAKQSVAAKSTAQHAGNGMDRFNGGINDSLRKATDVARGKSIDALPMALALLGRRQIVDIYGGLIPGMRAWSERIQHMDAQKNEVAHDADKIVTRWGKLPQEEADRLADLMHDSTLAQVEGDPDNYTAGTNFGIWPNKKALAQKTDELRARFNSLSAEAKSIYRDARDMYRDQWLKARDSMLERIQRSIMDGKEKKAMMDMIRLRFEESLRGVYFPLGRYGDYYITAVKKGDTSGERAAVVFAESSMQADEARRKLMKDFPASDYDVSNVQYRLDRSSMEEGASVDFVRRMYEVVDKQELDKATSDAMKDAVNQLYLSSLPDVSWAKHGIHRKGTPGYNSDARRNFAANMFHGGFYLARLNNMDILQANMKDMEEGMRGRSSDPEYDSVRAGIVLNELLKRQEKLTKVDNHPVANFLTGLGFVFHIGLVPASALTNLSQTALVAYPIMAAEFGHVGAFKELWKAFKEISTSLNIKDPANLFSLKFSSPEVQAAVERAVKEGVIDLTLAHDLAGVSEGKDTQLNKKWSPVMKMASWLFHQAELFNRLSTFAASYRLAVARGEAGETAYNTAVKITYDSHFDYSHSNRARVMSGPVSRVILLFKQYAQNMIYLLARNAYLSFKGDKQARKRLANVLAINAMATGAFGLPWIMGGGMMALAEALIGDDDEPWDAEAAVRNYLADAFGPEVSEALTRGAFRLLPGLGRADITGRVGLDALMFRGQDIQLEGAEWYHSIADAILGPVAGIALNASKGAADIAKGDWQRGLEQMVPTVFSGPLKAVRYAKEGVIDRTGVEIMADVDAIDLIVQSAGFTPSRVKERFDARRYVYGADKAIQERRKELMRRFSMGVIKQDDDMIADVLRDIELYNQRQPDFSISAQQLAASVKTREKRIAEADEGIYLPKPRRGLIELAAFAREEE